MRSLFRTSHTYCTFPTLFEPSLALPSARRDIPLGFRLSAALTNRAIA